MAVETVEQATELAVNFVRKYYSYVFPVSARRDAGRWIVDLDVSYFKPAYVRVNIRSESSSIEDFKVTLGQLL